MLYKNINDLALATSDAYLKPKDAADERLYLCRLINVYFEALHCPPPGVIGVGAISYAERVLIAAQNKA